MKRMVDRTKKRSRVCQVKVGTRSETTQQQEVKGVGSKARAGSLPPSARVSGLIRTVETKSEGANPDYSRQGKPYNT